MRQLPSALRRYLVMIWGVGLLAWAASGTLAFEQRTLSWPLMAVLLGLLILARRAPQHLFVGVKTAPDTIPLFIAVLCLPVSAAVSMAVAGVAAVGAWRRRPWCEVGFNAASTALQMFVAGTIGVGLARVGGSWIALAAAFAGAAAMYLLNSALVAGAVAAQHHLPYGRIWREVAGAEPLDHVLMFLVGGLFGLPWAWMPVCAGLLLSGLAVRAVLLYGDGCLLSWRPIRDEG